MPGLVIDLSTSVMGISRECRDRWRTCRRVFGSRAVLESDGDPYVRWCHCRRDRSEGQGSACGQSPRRSRIGESAGVRQLRFGRGGRRKTGPRRARRAASPAAGRPAGMVENTMLRQSIESSSVACRRPPSRGLWRRRNFCTLGTTHGRKRYINFAAERSGARRMRCRRSMWLPPRGGTGWFGVVTSAAGGSATQQGSVRVRKRAGCGASRWPSVFNGGGSRWLRGCGFPPPARRTRVRRRRRWWRAWRRSRP